MNETYKDTTMDVRYLLLFTIIIIMNSIFNCSIENMIVSVPQYLYIYYLLINGKITNAIFFHLTFFITSLGYNVVVDNAGNEIKNLVSYNYAKLSIGPFPLFLLTTLFMIYTCKRAGCIVSENAKCSAFYNLYKLLKYILLSGSIMMVFGFVFSHYYIQGVMTYGVYSLFLFIVSYLLLINFDSSLRKSLFQYLIPILIISIIVSFLINEFGVNSTGSLLIIYYGCILVPCIFFRKYSLIMFLVLCLFIYSSILTETGGKVIISVCFMIAATFTLSFNVSIKKRFPKRAKIAKLIFLSVAIFLPSIAVYMMLIASSTEGSNFMHKLHSVETLFGYFFGYYQLSEIDDSPLTRLAQFANIMYENLSNPLYMIFGRGFGGFYSDSLRLLYNLDLSGGTYNHVQISRGEYYYAHDAFVSVPFVSGLLGSYLWIKCFWSYIKNSNSNYLKLTAFPFLLLIFFFDTQIGTIGVLFLYASETNFLNTKFTI